jgi:hypothetical protein
MAMKRIMIAVGVALALAHAGARAIPAPPQDIDQLFAPIALYPDALLGPMLLSAQDPSKIGALSEWLRSNDTLKGTALQDAAKASGFSESYVAIVLFPQVVNTMAEQMEWTTKIGKAFTADRSAVFASIQRLRVKAKDAGKLKTNAQQEVTTETSASGQQVIVIEPANPQVVYVPQYNAQTVYVPTSSTVVIKEDDDNDAAIAAGLIGFTAGIALGAAMDNDYYYGPYGWGGGFRMYDDAWDDWSDHREDAREDYMDHRENMAEERGERARTSQEQRTDRAQSRDTTQQARSANRTERTGDRTDARTATGAERTSAERTSAERTSAGARGYSQEGARTTADRSGTKSDAFSGYSKGSSERAASSRGSSSRSKSSGGGGGRRR